MNRMSVVILALGLAAAVTLSACGRGGSDTSDLKEIQKQRTGDYVVTLLNSTGQLKQGKNELTLEVRKASDNALVDVGAIQSGTSMPMPGMPNMIGETSVTPSGTPGRYTVAATLQMQGTWNTTFTFANGQKVQFVLRTQ